jgi:hypothetical protein
MKIFAQWLLVFILAAILLAYVSGEAADKQTGRLYARAHLSEVQNEGRKDLMAGLMPYAVIGVVGVMSIMALALAAIALAKMGQPPQQSQQPVIERQMIILIQPGQSRREVYKMLGGE